MVQQVDDKKKKSVMPARGAHNNSGGKPKNKNEKKNDKPQQTSSNQRIFNGGKPVEFEILDHEAEQESTGQARLFVGGLPEGITQEQVRGMFMKYGDVKEVFIPQGKSFAFVKMSNRSQADQAKYGLSGKKIIGQMRPIRVKFAAQGTSVEVKNLSPLISNERLYDAFSRFGQIERAVVMVDERGKSLERGLVEFDRKISAQKAIQQVNEGCFFLTMSPRAVVCGAVDAVDDADGLREESMYNFRGFEEEYSYPPRFAAPETFEMDFGNRWKALEELERSQIEAMRVESRERKSRLEQEMGEGLGEEQERIIRMEMEQQQLQLRQMEDQRLRRQGELRSRHEQEIEEQKRHRNTLNDSHQRLKGLVDGKGMRPADQYRAPPSFQPLVYQPEDNYQQEASFSSQGSGDLHGHGGWAPPKNDWHSRGGGQGPLQNFNDPIQNILNDELFEQTVNQLRQDSRRFPQNEPRGVGFPQRGGFGSPLVLSAGGGGRGRGGTPVPRRGGGFGGPQRGRGRGQRGAPY